MRTRRTQLSTQEKLVYHQKAIALFNQEKFYEAHEAWEEIWLREQSENKRFYQALIVVAGGFHHIQKKRFQPAKKALNKASFWLSQFSELHLQINQKLLCEQIEKIIALIENQNVNFLLFPKI